MTTNFESKVEIESIVTSRLTATNNALKFNRSESSRLASLAEKKASLEKLFHSAGSAFTAINAMEKRDPPRTGESMVKQLVSNFNQAQ